MEKPKLQTRSFLDYYEMIRYVEEKYNIDVSNYSYRPGDPTHYEWYGMETNDPSPFPGHYLTKEQIKLNHEQYRRYIDWSRLNPEPPYLDYWHWLLDNCFSDEMSNGIIRSWDIHYILTEDSPQWVKEITELIVEEFKEFIDENGLIEVLIEW